METKPFPDVMKLRFDPYDSGPLLVDIFDEPLARAFYLCWRSNHMISDDVDDFHLNLLEIVRRIRVKQPQTVEELQTVFAGIHTHDFTPHDLEHFAPRFFPYLLGERKILWQRTE